MNLKFCVAAMLLLYMQSRLQAQITSHTLNINDKLPDITLHVQNYNRPTATLSDFRGKLVILDFWASWCANCTAFLPQLQALQERFKDSVQIILVNCAATGDKNQQIQGILSRLKNKTGKAITLPLVVEDTMLYQLFPYKFLPQDVWIDAGGVIKAITASEEVTVSNISQMLQDTAATLHHKKDMMNFDARKPLFVDGNGAAGDALLYRSTITSYIEGTGYGTAKNTNEDGEITRFCMLNSSLYALYSTAFKHILNLPPNRTFIHIRNPQLLKTDTVDYTGRFCYEIITPPEAMDTVLALMRQDLERAFHITVKSATKSMEVLVLTATEGVPFTKSAPPEWETAHDDMHKRIINQPVSSLVDLLNTISTIPVIDESGVTKHIDIVLPDNLYTMDTKALTAMLAAYGFTLTTAQRTVPIAVITDK